MMLQKPGSYRIMNRPENKELSIPTPLLIHPDRQGFSYADPADRNPPPDAELSKITMNSVKQ
jgi:hypothetical protein